MKREYYPQLDDSTYAILNEFAADFLKQNPDLLRYEHVEMGYKPGRGFGLMDNVEKVCKGISKIDMKKNIHHYNACRSSWDELVESAKVRAMKDRQRNIE